MNKYDLMIILVELFPCPNYNGEEVIILVEKSLNLIIIYDDVCGYVGSHKHYHVRNWANRLCSFINLDPFLISVMNE